MSHVRATIEAWTSGGWLTSQVNAAQGKSGNEPAFRVSLQENGLMAGGDPAALPTPAQQREDARAGVEPGGLASLSIAGDEGPAEAAGMFAGSAGQSMATVNQTAAPAKGSAASDTGAGKGLKDVIGGTEPAKEHPVLAGATLIHHGRLHDASAWQTEVQGARAERMPASGSEGWTTPASGKVDTTLVVPPRPTEQQPVMLVAPVADSESAPERPIAPDSKQLSGGVAKQAVHASPALQGAEKKSGKASGVAAADEMPGASAIVAQQAVGPALAINAPAPAVNGSHFAVPPSPADLSVAAQSPRLMAGMKPVAVPALPETVEHSAATDGTAALYPVVEARPSTDGVIDGVVEGLETGLLPQASGPALPPQAGARGAKDSGAKSVGAVSGRKPAVAKETLSAPVPVAAEPVPAKAATHADASPLPTLQVAPTAPAPGSSVMLAPVAAPHAAVAEARIAGAAVEARPTVEHVPVSAENSSPGPSQPGDVRTLTASPQVLEVGVASGTHGWLRVRAEMGSGGEVAASVVASSASQAEALHHELPALHAYLSSEQVGVSSVVVSATEATAPGGAAASSADGQRDGRQPAGEQARAKNFQAEVEPWNGMEAGVLAGRTETMSRYGRGGGWVNVRV